MPFRLRTFGGLSLTGESGPVTGAAAQRRKLALLAVLAAGGDRGVSRDRLLALFSPQSDTEHGRHALTQSLSALRRELDCDDLFLGTTDLGLNTVVIESDVAGFETALARVELERAVALYVGPFLDGVHLDRAHQSPEFERWVEVERGRLQGLAADALERLAAGAAALGHQRRAAEWWSRLSALDPFSSRFAAGLVSALVASGDAAAALRQARTYETLVREELGLQPDGTVLALATRLRPPNRLEPAASRPDAAVPLPRVDVAAAPASAAPPRWRLATPTRLALALTLLAATMGGAALALRHRHTPLMDPQKVAVAVFENRTGDPNLDLLGPMAADWLTRGLAMTQLVKVADLRDELAASHIATNVERQRETFVVEDFGAETGAGTVVRGWYSQQGDTLEFAAAIVDARRGRSLGVVHPARVGRREPLKGLAALRSEVTLALAKLLSPGLAAWVSHQDQPPAFPAYREYLQGIGELDENGDDAALHLKAAFALDSTLADALVWAAFAHLGEGEVATADTVARMLEPRRRQLTPYERYKLDELRATIRGDNSAAYESSLLALAADPGSIAATIDAADAALGMNHPREAARLLTEVDPERGRVHRWEHYWWMLTSADHMLGDYRRELADARRGRVLFPNLLTTLANEIRALAALGRIDDLERDLDESLTLRSSGWFTHLLLMVVAAQELRVHGRELAAERVRQRALALYDALPPRDRRADAFAHAALLGTMGRWREAFAIHDSVWATDRGNMQLAGWVGEAAAAMGDRRTAMRVDALLEASRRPYQLGLETDGRALIAAALGDREHAVALLREAFAQGRVYSVYTHCNTPRLWDYPPFQELMRPKG